MADEEGPWRQGSEEEEPRRPRTWLWLLLLLAVGGLVAALFRLFPGAVRTGDDWFSLGYGLGLVLLLSTVVLQARAGRWRQHLRYAGIWLAIVGVLALGFAYQDELMGVGQRLRLAAGGGEPVAIREHQLAVEQDMGGAFTVIGRVNGERVRFMVDTGASETVLSPDDARRLGVDVGRLRFDREAETANGIGYGASWRADRLEVGPIAIGDFPMTINQAPMSVSLLGMSFLSRLESFEVRGRTLILRY